MNIFCTKKPRLLDLGILFQRKSGRSVQNVSKVRRGGATIASTQSHGNLAYCAFALKHAYFVSFLCLCTAFMPLSVKLSMYGAPLEKAIRRYR